MNCGFRRMPAMGKGEFERIADYFAPLAAGYPGAFNLTDDAALISPDAGQSLIVTTDTIVEGVHYSRRASSAQLQARCRSNYGIVEISWNVPPRCIWCHRPRSGWLAQRGRPETRIGMARSKA